ncbi:hypothetical protein HYX12_04785 [Candidatus Woesearchaeota archaeon]|nr:hypothetical protein [Candidatus Woesearchaeota archaeon]
MNELKQLTLETLRLNKQALIFVPNRASAEKTAEDLSACTNLSLLELEQEVLHALSSPTKQCRRLSHCIKKGIAFHHAGLTQKQKELIEENFRQGVIKIICCTPTLAAGLSMPAYRVIITSLKRFTGSWGMDWIPVLEYMQMAGRAGRPEFEKEGQSIILAKNDLEKEEIYEKYICGVPEEIYSKLAVEPVLRTYLLSLISSGVIRDEKSMLDFFDRTFWSFQFQDKAKLQKIMEKMLHLLEEWKFISITGDGIAKENKNVETGFVSAKEYHRKDGQDNSQKNKILRATAVGKRISELYLDPWTANYFLNCLKNHSADSTPFSLLQMISHTLELRPLLRVKAKEQEKIQAELVKRYDILIEQEPSAYDDEYSEFINSIKTALFFEAWINEYTEDFLLENYDIRPGEIRVKLETADWLLYAIEELAKLQDYKEVNKQASKLRYRLKYGVKEELMPLLKLENIGRIRARKMFDQGIKDLGDVKKIDITSLRQILGQKIADDVKKQVGEEVKEIPKGTRKGQLSIEKFN